MCGHYRRPFFPVPFHKCVGDFLEVIMHSLIPTGNLRKHRSGPYLTEQPQSSAFHGREQRVNIDLGVHRRFPVYRKKMNLRFTRNKASVINSVYARTRKIIINFTGDLQELYSNTTSRKIRPTRMDLDHGLLAGGEWGLSFPGRIDLTGRIPSLITSAWKE